MIYPEDIVISGHKEIVELEGIRAHHYFYDVKQSSFPLTTATQNLKLKIIG